MGRLLGTYGQKREATLKVTVGRTTLSYDELQTTVLEIEAIVNAINICL